jgi:RNA polymerase primary sigma factor
VLCAECRAVNGTPAHQQGPLRSSRHEIAPLYRWQREALEAWRNHGSRGVIEAVTGAGKTRVALVAIDELIARGGRAAVVVPTIDLQKQWAKLLLRYLPESVRVGYLGDGDRGDLGRYQVVVAVAASAARRPLLPRLVGFPALLVADECHRYGAISWANILDDRFTYRLGLTATYEREDGGVDDFLGPFFGGICYRLNYAGALADGAVCDFRLAFVGVRFTANEKANYEEQAEGAYKFKRILHEDYGLPREPFGDFMLQANVLSKGSRADGALVARAYLGFFSRRRAVLASAEGKLDRLRQIVPAVKVADRSILFSQTRVAAARAIEMFSGVGLRAAVLHAGMDRWERREVLADFEDDKYDVVGAPKLLDEGIDVPAADLAMILATSRSRRQMVQRMGRVLRKKEDGRAARIAIFFVEGTTEDPAEGSHEDFLELIQPVALQCVRFPDDESASTALIDFLSNVGRVASEPGR